MHSDILFVGRFGMDLRGFTTEHNHKSGIFISNYQLPVHMHDVESSQNEHGILVSDSSVFVLVNSSVFSNNKVAGFATSNSDGVYEISRSEIVNNLKGISVTNDKNCYYSYVHTRVMHSLVVTESLITKNGFAGVAYDSNCRHNTECRDNTFHSNSKVFDYINNGYRIQNDIILNH